MHGRMPGPIARYIPDANEGSITTMTDTYQGQHALWHVMDVDTGGIPLSEPGPATPASILHLSAQQQALLICLLHKGSEWEGW